MALTAQPNASAAARWLGQHVRGNLHSDSRGVSPGDGFIAWPGRRHDARRFVPALLRAGAAACLVEADGVEAFGFDDARIATLPRLAQQCGAVAHEFFGRPSERLSVLAVTGTNGKTSTAWWLAQALAWLGQRCAVVGTLGIGEPVAGAAFDSTGLTTPDAVALHRALRNFADQGFVACAMEASSIGLQEHRLAGTQIRVALFSNLTQDHLDYHGSMAAYWRSKRALFAWPGLQDAVVNVDDAQGRELADELRSGALNLWTCSMRGNARLRGSELRYVDGGLAFEVHEGEHQVPVRSRLIGDFNASNLLLVIGGLRALGITLDDAARAVATMTPVPGRMQRVPAVDVNAPDVVVDYAHTPDALDKALRALRPFAASRGGRLWCVFGCGGNRDAAKRPLMGAVAQALADAVVLTSDNPRDEVPAAILTQIVAGIEAMAQVVVIEDRGAAIAHAVQHASATDVILLAGKGHEATQEVAGQKRVFSDLAQAGVALRQRARGRA
jgi:UDP-N-acetylmuramoyl-L-alanyl-D-glutamate--2,6-diaminopimelate ligase